jgi:hypothetical protein
LSLSGTSATFVDYGRVYDNSPSNWKFFFVPSIMVNNAGSVLVAFSGSGNNDYIGAFCAGRLTTDPAGWMSPIRTLHVGESAYPFLSWGDYSHASLDPNDKLGIWTIQQYASSPTGAWRTWIAELVPITP